MAGDITTIARPYAAAVFARAQETGEVAAWSDALGLLAAIGSDPELARQLGNPNIPREAVRDIVLNVAGDALPTEAANLVRLLAANDRLALLPEEDRIQSIRHRILRGDTLSTIAQHYRTTVERLLKVNNLENTEIIAGEVLVVPGS